MTDQKHTKDPKDEMLRYLPVLERAESNPSIWATLTEGTGIATLNGYRNALSVEQPNFRRQLDAVTKEFDILKSFYNLTVKERDFERRKHNRKDEELLKLTKQWDKLKKALEKVAAWQDIEHICEDESWCHDDRKDCVACIVESALFKTKESA